MGEISKPHTNAGKVSLPTIPDTEGSTKLLILYFSGGCWKGTLSNYWRDQQDTHQSLRLLVFTSRTTTEFISYLQKQTQKPFHPMREKTPFAQYNTTQGFSGTLACWASFCNLLVKKSSKKCVLCDKQKQHSWNSCDTESRFSVVIYKLFFPIVGSFIN